MKYHISWLYFCNCSGRCWELDELFMRYRRRVLLERRKRAPVLGYSGSGDGRTMGQFNTTISLKSSTKRISPLSEISYGCFPINSLKLSADGHQTSRARQPFSEKHSAQVSYIDTSSNKGELCIPAIHLQGTICHEDCKGIEQGFWNRWNVPQILHPTDGKHISIICPR